MDEWRTDFENAPMGGSQVQIYVPDFGQYIATWSRDRGEWTVGDREFIETTLPAEPTHWREPPSDPEGN